MNIVAIVIAILTLVETYFIGGVGITLLLLLPSRVGYILNTFAFNKKVRTCVKWEVMAIAWVIVKALVFKSVILNWKQLIILSLFGLVVLGIEFWDETQNVYIIEDIVEERDKKQDLLEQFKE